MIQLTQWACYCGAQSEGTGEPPSCWSCGKPMHQWGTRMAEHAPAVLGEVSDAR